jgi:hypothetical protein
VALFAERAASVVPGFSIAEDNRLAVAEICRDPGRLRRVHGGARSTDRAGEASGAFGSVMRVARGDVPGPQPECPGGCEGDQQGAGGAAGAVAVPGERTPQGVERRLGQLQMALRLRW